MWDWRRRCGILVCGWGRAPYRSFSSVSPTLVSQFSLSNGSTVRLFSLRRNSNLNGVISSEDCNDADEESESTKSVMFTGMELQFFGTSSSKPTKFRNVTSIALKTEEGTWLFDAGEATQHRMLQFGVRPGHVRRIFITHMHGDHTFGLPGVFCSIAHYSSPTREPLDVFGPVSLDRFLRSNLSLTLSNPDIDFRIHELSFGNGIFSPFYDEKYWKSRLYSRHPDSIFPSSDATWKILDSEKYFVHAAEIQHRVPCFGYVVKEKDTPGRIDVDKCSALGLAPGPLYKELKAGRSVPSTNGAEISPDDVVGPPRLGRKVVILGDTCSAGSIMETLSWGADVVVHECTLSDEMEKHAVERGHATPRIAAEFARNAGAKCLILTHFSVKSDRDLRDRGSPTIILPGDSRRPKQNIAGTREATVEDLCIAAAEYLDYKIPVIGADDFMLFQLGTIPV